MTKNTMRIIFMGTPDFAVPSLKILLENGFEIAAVVTAPDRSGGRLGLLESPVKKFAAERGLPILQPEKLKSPQFLEKLASFRADLQVVVAFRMLPEAVWAMPPLGSINLHGSLLPKYRGAAPIHWAVIRGERETGCTTFFLKHEIDTGDLLFQEKIAIGPDATTGEIHDEMMEIGAKLVLKTVKSIENGIAVGYPQPDEAASHAPKIFTETCQIDFSKTVGEVHNFVRGLSPHPGAWTIFEEKTLKIFRSKKIDTQPTEPPGSWATDGKNFLRIACADGWLDVLELQPEKKRRMGVVDFLNGHKIEKNMKNKLTIPLLIEAAKTFCEAESQIDHAELFGKTDGKAVGTYVEHKFQQFLAHQFEIEIGDSATGIDLPSPEINTDIKVTYFKQPQSSCPFRDARQKIFGLGYNLLVFVYDKLDDPTQKATKLNFLHCTFVEKERTADWQTTFQLRQLIDNQAVADDIAAFLFDRNIPLDESGIFRLAAEIMENRPEQGWLTISNALQWRLQYGRLVGLSEEVEGITQIVKKAS